MFQNIESFFSSIEKTGIFIAVACALLMMFIISLNALGRYFMSSPIPATITIVELYFMIGLVYLAASDLQAHEGNIGLDILTRRLSDPVTSIIRIAYLAITVSIFAYIIYIVKDHAIHLTFTGGSVAFGLPTWVSWWLMILGIGLLCVRMVLQIFEEAWSLTHHD